MPKLYNRLIELRKANLYTQSAISERLQIGQKRYAAWEEGRAEPNIEMLIKIADCYGLTIDELIRGDINNAVDPINNLKEEELLNQIVINCHNAKILLSEILQWIREYRNGYISKN
jgi:transcriptional regulator with XRE-family HTH domain